MRLTLLQTGLLSLSLAVAATNQAGGEDARSPGELVRKAVQNEMKAKDDPVKYMFRDHKQTLSGSQTKRMVETREAMVGMVIAYNDHPLDQQQRRAEIARVERFLNDPDEMQKKQKQERENADRVSRIIRALPDAFLYESDGTETGKAGMGLVGEELVRLKFRPNPRYDPPSRVEQVLTGMQGTVLIDAKRNRLARIDGTLFKDVGFGWGILGHLDRGGRVAIEQGEVSEGSWEITRLEYALTGKILLFKSINYKTTEDFSEFHPVAPDLTFAQGLELLKKQEVDVAEVRSGQK